MSDLQGPPDPTGRDPGPDPKSMSVVASLMAKEEGWTVFRRFDEFNLLNLLMLQDEILKLSKEFEEWCESYSDKTTTADSAWYTPSNIFASHNVLADQAVAEEHREGLRSLESPDSEQVRRLREELARKTVLSSFPKESTACWDSVHDDDFVVVRGGADKGSRVSNWIKLCIGILQWEFWERKQIQLMLTIIPEQQARTLPASTNEPRVIVVGKQQPPISKAEMAKKHAFASRLIMAFFGGFALIVPTVIMAKVEGINVSLITTSVAVLMFGLALAFGATDSTGKDVLAATAAYTAVLVVFVGTSLAGDGSGNNTKASNSTTNGTASGCAISSNQGHSPPSPYCISQGAKFNIGSQDADLQQVSRDLELTQLKDTYASAALLGCLVTSELDGTSYIIIRRKCAGLPIIPSMQLTAGNPLSTPTALHQAHNSPIAMAETVDLSLATRANNLQAVPNLVEDIKVLSKNLEAGSENVRHELFLKARSLVQSLQTPRELMLQHTWADPGLNAALISCVDIGLWKLMVKNGIDTSQKVDDLARTLEVDPVLLGRLMRHVCAMGHLEEMKQDEYKLTNFSKSLSLDVIGDGYLALFRFGGIGRSPIEFYKFLHETKWQNPVDAAHTAMHASYNTDQPNCFEYLRFIDLGPHTNHHMGGYRQGRLPWMHPSVYPVEKTLFPGADNSPDAPLVVDVAGGLSHDINEFKKFYPNHPGKLILQDLPVVINDVRGIDSSIELMGHDFLTEQPIKGARAYFMHSIMHDWPDHVCRKILAPLAQSMKPGYSKLLIFECVIPKTGAYWEATAGDILMMTQLSAVERTEDHWHQLIEGIGLNLNIVKFWKCGQSDVENLIECELAQDA
ncbi:hypothetical protein FDECE_6464 [Fusarium decemcellulare]|nr:hypothetical protein FDECE_6464 [Fusarium decemcellulare]